MLTHKQLGQVRPPTAGTAVTLYTVPAGTQAINLVLFICNQTASASTYTIFQDDEGSGSGSTTMLYNTVTIAAAETAILQLPPLSTEGAIITVKSGNNNALTFTLGGIEIVDPVHKILGQLFPASTTATVIHTLTSGQTLVNLRMNIVNRDASSRTYRLYQDDDGDALGSSNHVAWEIPILPGARHQVNLLPMNKTGGVIGVRTSSASTLCFTLSGTVL